MSRSTLFGTVTDDTNDVILYFFKISLPSIVLDKLFALKIWYNQFQVVVLVLAMRAAFLKKQINSY